MEFKETIKVTENIKRVSLLAGLSDVVVKSGDRLEIDFFGRQAAGQKPTVSCNIIEDKLGISVLPVYTLLTGERPSIIVTVPQLEYLQIHSEGKIQVKEGVKVDNIVALGANEYITLEVLAQSIQARTTSGNIMVFSNATNMQLETIEGRVTVIPEANEDTKLQINSISGNIMIGATQNENRYREIISNIKTISGKTEYLFETDERSKFILEVSASSVDGNIVID